MQLIWGLVAGRNHLFPKHFPRHTNPNNWTDFPRHVTHDSNMISDSVKKHLLFCSNLYFYVLNSSHNRYRWLPASLNTHECTWTTRGQYLHCLSASSPGTFTDLHLCFAFAHLDQVQFSCAFTLQHVNRNHDKLFPVATAAHSVWLTGPQALYVRIYRQ